MNRKTGCRNDTPEGKDTDLNKWMMPLVRCNKNFTKFKGKFLIENFNRFYLI
jgi:hypothetical protein